MYRFPKLVFMSILLGVISQLESKPREKIGYTVSGQPVVMHWLCRPHAPSEYLQFIKDLIPAGRLVFDVGANAGDKADIYLQCGAQKVICFEPDQRPLQGLHKRFATNASVVIEPVGLAAEEGTLDFMACKELSGLSTFAVETLDCNRFTGEVSWDSQGRCRVTTLDQMIVKHGLPWYCKIDVEGFEYQVLRGLSQRIPLLSFECNIEHWESTKLCLLHLQRLGYRKFNFAFAERGLFLFEQWNSRDEFVSAVEELLQQYYFPKKWWLYGDIYAQ